MNYKLSKKKFGVKDTEILLDISTSEKIVDIALMDSSLIYAHGSLLGMVDLVSKIYSPWKGDRDFDKSRDGTNPVFANISSISCLDSLFRIFVAEDGGRSVRVVNVKENYTDSLVTGQNSELIKSSLRKQKKDAPAYICAIGKDHFSIVYESIRKCFDFKDSAFSHIAGDGRCTYSVSDSAINSSIGMPSGIATYKGKVFLSDKWFNTIRAVDKGQLSLVCGHPKQEIIEDPGKIVVWNELLYIVCKDAVYSCPLSRKVDKPMVVYRSEHISSVATDRQGNLYILEENNA